MSKLRIHILFVLIFSANSILAQTADDSFTGSFENMTLTDFCEKIESTYDYHFYFDQKGTDTLLVNIDAQEQGLGEILDEILSGTDYSYLVTDEKNVFITYDITIRDELPIGFFDVDNTSEVKLDLAALNFQKQNSAVQGKTGIEDQLIHIGTRSSQIQPGSATLAGHIRDESSGEAVIGAVVYVKELNSGVASDQFGYYSITLPRGKHTVQIQSIGMKTTRREIILYTDGNLDVELSQDVIALKEVVVESEKDINVSGIQMGLEKIDMATLKQVPTILGERDVLKIALTLPGVQTVGEGASGFNVRGGAADQNLVTINDAAIFNSAHFFGFFSVFNPDVVKSVDLYKSGIPAQYGGRISSIFEVQMKDGNKKKLSVSGGISPVTGRLTVEGPIVKDKTSFIIGARSTYSDWLLNQIPDEQLRGSSAGFYDISTKISHTFSEKDEMNVSAYYSKDRFNLYSDSLYKYSNFNATAQWKHFFNNKLYGVVSGIYTDYQYSLSNDRLPVNAFDLSYRLKTANAKIDFSYFPSSKHKVDFGISSIFYGLEPGNLNPLGDSSIIAPFSLENEQGVESAVYVGDQIEISNRFSVYLGLRYSLYNYLGPKSVNVYEDEKPKEPGNISDTNFYEDGENIQTYHGPEYRASLRYSLTSSSSLKLSFNRLRQYIHMLSNSAAISPTDTWKLSDTHIRPQIGDQLSLGYYRNLQQNSIELSIEAYYKNIIDIVDYKGGAKLLLNDKIETDLINGSGKSYGLEFFLKKKFGKLNGWVSYTYSRALIQINGDYPEEKVNGGEYFPADYDKPHSLNVIANYKINRRFNISSNFVYSTGRPITFPVAKYNLGNSETVFYSDRNEFRIPDYIRLDLSMQIEGNHKVKKLAHSSWSISVYNVLGRDNVYSMYFTKEGADIQGYKLSIFANPIPTITYNFRF